MKKIISSILAFLMLLSIVPVSYANNDTVEAVKATQKITLDGEEIKIGSYLIQGRNYVKIRDIAAIMNDKECKFNVRFDKKRYMVVIEIDRSYEKIAGDLEEIKDEKAQAKLLDNEILVSYTSEKDEQQEEKHNIYNKIVAKTALINRNNYIQLRDLGKIVGFGVNYNKSTSTVELKSEKDYNNDEFTSNKFTENDEVVFSNLEKLFKNLVDDNKTEISKISKELTTLYENSDPDSYEINSDGILNNFKQISSRITKNLKKEYSLEKMIENYDDGKAYVIVFNFNDSYIAIQYFPPTSSIQFISNVGDYSKGVMEDHYQFKNLLDGFLPLALFSFHAHLISKDYEGIKKNLEILGIQMDIEKIKNMVDMMTTDKEILKPDYIYVETIKNFFDGYMITYLFDYDTSKQFQLTYSEVDKKINSKVINKNENKDIKDKTNN